MSEGTDKCKLSFASSPNSWRKLVIERDNYICQVCRKKGESSSLEAHHIIPLELIEKHEKLCPLALLIANGMAVHRNCHPEKGMALGQQKAEDLLRQMLGEDNWEILESHIFGDFLENEEEVDTSEELLKSDGDELDNRDEVLDGLYIGLYVDELLEDMQRKYRNAVKRRLIALGLDNIANWSREQIIEAKSYKQSPEPWQNRVNAIKTAIA